MKNIIILMVLLATGTVTSFGQQIIPFPDLSESHIAVYNQAELIDDHNYSYFTKDYQVALRQIDLKIEEIDELIGKKANQSQKKLLESQKEALVKKRSELVEEAELVEDLGKFY